MIGGRGDSFIVNQMTLFQFIQEDFASACSGKRLIPHSLIQSLLTHAYFKQLLPAPPPHGVHIWDFSAMCVKSPLEK